MTPVVDTDLFEYALIKPALAAKPADELFIVSGYASHALASGHISVLKSKSKAVNIDLIYGMAGEGVSDVDYLGFKSLHNHAEYAYDGSFDCRYVRRPTTVHAKVYVWCRHGIPLVAFSGSANYTNNGFKAQKRVEVLSECDPVSAFDFYNKIKKGTVPCHKASPVEFVLSKQKATPNPVKIDKGTPVVFMEMDKDSAFYGCARIDIPLRNSKGHFGIESGLNWGLDANGNPRLQHKNNPHGGHRDPNEAYIRLPKTFDCGFFPRYVPVPKGKSATDAQIRFSVLTDDNEMFSCIRASGGYGKEIETPQDNAELGRWFRKRLGLKSGALITDAAMKQYGRETVTFYKLADDQFYMDFSV